VKEKVSGGKKTSTEESQERSRRGMEESQEKDYVPGYKGKSPAVE